MILGSDGALRGCIPGRAAHVRGSGTNGHSYWVVHQTDLHIQAFWIDMKYLYDFRVAEAFPEGVGVPETVD